MNIKAVVSKAENHIYWKKIEWGFYDKMDDESFLKMAYKRKFGKELDLKNPVTFNEKLQWLKLHDRKPEYTTMVDKYEAKAYIAQKIGEEYVVPTLGVWEKFDDIDFTKLPNAFVLKCTHDSGGLVICKDKSKLDRKKARKKEKRTIFLLEWDGKIAIQKRPAEGLLAGLYEFPAADGHLDGAQAGAWIDELYKRAGGTAGPVLTVGKERGSLYDS